MRKLIAGWVVGSSLLCWGAQAQKTAQAPRWVASWATSVYVPEKDNLLPDADMTDATLRQVVHLSLGGARLRLKVSNEGGTSALHLAALHVALPAPAGGIVAASDRAVTFSGLPDVLIPPGAAYVSDAVEMQVAPLADLAITFYLDQPPARQTGHPGSRAVTYVQHGNHVADPALSGAKTVEHWYQIAEVDVEAAGKAGTVVALGDSITDGHAAGTDKNERWPDELARRIAASGMGVANEGIGGNHMLSDGLGPNALARFDRDVLAIAGVRTVILLEGVNDLGGLTIAHEVSDAEHAAFVKRILASYEQVIQRGHAAGLKVIGGTITPYVGSDYYHPGPKSEADRQTINAWIRAAGHFDSVVDFDKAVRDPAHPDRLNPAYDCGDHLHPSPAGYKVMGDAIDRQAIAW